MNSTNVTISGVKSELGESTNALSSLCKSNNINIWSKWKPIQSTAATLTTDLLKAANYGVALDTTLYNEVPYNVVKHFATRSNVPTSNYRLGDFRYYNANAKPPIQWPTNVTVAAYPATVTLTFPLNAAGNNSYIGATEFDFIKNKHLCVLVGDTANSSTPNLYGQIKTSTKTIAEGGNTLTVTGTVTGTSAQNYYMFYMLADDVINSTDSWASFNPVSKGYKFYPLPSTTPAMGILKVKGSSSSSDDKIGDHYGVVNVYNNTSSSITFTITTGKGSKIQNVTIAAGKSNWYISDSMIHVTYTNNKYVYTGPTINVSSPTSGVVAHVTNPNTGVSYIDTVCGTEFEIPFSTSTYEIADVYIISDWNA